MIRSTLSSTYGTPAHRSAPLIRLFDPLRNKAGFKDRGSEGEGESGPQISPPTKGLPLHSLILSEKMVTIST